MRRPESLEPGIDRGLSGGVQLETVRGDRVVDELVQEGCDPGIGGSAPHISMTSSRAASTSNVAWFGTSDAPCEIGTSSGLPFGAW